MELARGIDLLSGDCLEVLARLPPDHFDSCCTDPPYHLVSIVKRFGKEGSAPINNADEKMGRHGPYHRASVGFMGKEWDGGDVAFRCDFWAEVYRVLKPGAFLCAFGATRGYHRMACAIEDAGFEIRDSLCWLYGTGFPKSHDVSKGIDRAAGAERERYNRSAFGGTFSDDNGTTYGTALSNEPATEAAAQWTGWGTALKPAFEPIVLARKPLSEGTVAANVLRWGTGAINISACRVEHATVNGGNLADNPHLRSGKGAHDEVAASGFVNNHGFRPSQSGRWPANVVHDGSDEVVGMFPYPRSWGDKRADAGEVSGYDDSGSAARFFYSAKADFDDRLGSSHPTVKPVDLMQWLCRLVTPPGGLILDPFAGTGTTGEAAWREKMRATLIEREPEYQDDIRRRMTLMMASTTERRRHAHKEKQRRKPLDDTGTLFANAPKE